MRLTLTLGPAERNNVHSLSCLFPIYCEEQFTYFNSVLIAIAYGTQLMCIHVRQKIKLYVCSVVTALNELNESENQNRTWE